MIKIRCLAKKIPGLKPLYRSYRKLKHDVKANRKIAELRKGLSEPFKSNPESNLIVSLTSFPARISTVWITIETIFQQTYKPWKVVLVLAEEEFPDKKLPMELNQQIARGLEILWTPRNTRSYKKLLPVREAYPDAVIVTFDDDIFYEPWLVSQLVEESKKHPNAVIGHRGWEVTLGESGLEPYIAWQRATTNTLPDRVLLTGVGGILYPPHVMDEAILLNTDLALQLSPTADDIWFWVNAIRTNIPVICLGNHEHDSIKYDDSDTSLSVLNCGGGQNDVQLKNVISHFDLWGLLTNPIQRPTSACECMRNLDNIPSKMTMKS